ncbi:MAG TPA: hypothetical protein ENH15_00545 [Actinobacteria bacterium]|nr:hypothetical protein [Actinomycetota bacterium]
MDTSGRADLVTAWAVGVGIGLVTLQVTWLVANRIATLFLGAPRGPIIAFTTAVAVGIITSAIAGKRLARKIGSPSSTLPATGEMAPMDR